MVAAMLSQAGDRPRTLRRWQPHTMGGLLTSTTCEFSTTKSSSATVIAQLSRIDERDLIFASAHDGGVPTA